MRKRYLLLLLLLNWAAPRQAAAQAINTIADQTKFNSYFLYEVKLIEEFIERFNDVPGSYIRTQCRSLFGTDTMITRTRLLKSLLNKKQSWSGDTTLFIKEITDSRRPQYVNFTDSTWYAEANCSFLYRNQQVMIPIVLHISTVNGTYKWMIAGIGNSEVFRTSTPSLPTEKMLSTSGDFMPTSSYGTNFIVFNGIFTDKITPADYLDRPLLQTPKARIFVQLLLEHKLRFVHVKSIRYHFFQIQNRIFTVEQFKRKDANTGWLISSIEKVNQQNKADRIRQLLYP